MVKKILLLSSFALLIILNGCTSASGTLFTKVEPRLDKSLVYVFRNDNFMDAEIFDVPYVYINDQKVGRVRTGGYTFAEITPGPVNIKLKKSLLGIPVRTMISSDLLAKPGQTYFFQMDWHECPDGSCWRVSLTPIQDSESAYGVLAKSRYQGY